MNRELLNDIIQWDVASWAKALRYWEQKVDWPKVNNCLELGAREGGLSLWMALKGKQVVCSDFSGTKHTAEKLHIKHNVTSLITYQDIDASNISFENHFDVVLFKSILGGINKENKKEIQQQVIDQIYKALKPGGKLLFAENLTATQMHQAFRKRFNKWSKYWRYITIDECREYMRNFSSVELETTGVLATFGRTEKQKHLLSKADQVIFNKTTPNSWKYIVYGVASK